MVAAAAVLTLAYTLTMLWRAYRNGSLRGDDVVYFAVHENLPMFKQHPALANSCNQVQVVADHEQGLALLCEFFDLRYALALEGLVADRTAIEQRPAPDGSVFLVASKGGKVALPGVTLRARRGRAAPARSHR